MKRAILALFCFAFLLAHVPSAQAGDQDMANRYLRAAQSGDDDAQFYIGALYSAGVGVPRDDEEAFRWFSRAANRGHSHTMLIVAGLYAVGRGVDRDNVEAYKWAYLVGAASRIEQLRNGAFQLMGVLESRMASEEINRAKADAARWHALPTSPSTEAVPPAVPAAAPPAASPVPASTPAAISAHIDLVVNDARRNAPKLGANH
jgi:TPR repeat protein